MYLIATVLLNQKKSREIGQAHKMTDKLHLPGLYCILQLSFERIIEVF